MDFNSYDDQTIPTDRRQQSSSTQIPYTHPDWPERPDQGDQPIPCGILNPTFSSSGPYLSQPNTYGTSSGNLVSVQQPPLRTPFSISDSANVNADSSDLHGDPFARSNEEYRRRGGGFPSQQHTTFGHQALAQISPPPALYHPDQMLDHPGGQTYRHQVLPLSDVSTESSALDMFRGGSLHSRVPSQDGCVYWVCARGT